MGRFVKGEVVVLPFPFSDLSSHKIRPALVVANLPGDDMVLCMITTQARDPDSVSLSNSDFTTGDLPADPCNIRPNRLFTGEDTIVIKSRGRLSASKMTEVTNRIVHILTR